MGRRSSPAAAPGRVAITGASVLPGVPLPVGAGVGGGRPARYLPPAVDDLQPAERPRALPVPDRATHGSAASGAAEDDLVRARVLLADPPADGQSHEALPPMTMTIPFPPPRGTSPLAERSGTPRHRAADAAAPAARGAGATLLLTGLVIAVLAAAFGALVLPGLLGATGAPGPGDTGGPRSRTVALAPPAGYHVATRPDDRERAAAALAVLDRLGVPGPVAAAYARPDEPIQVIASGIARGGGAHAKQAFLTAWHRTTQARSVTSVASLPETVVGTCGSMRSGEMRGAGCAFAGDEVVGLLWMPRAGVAAAARALPAAVRSVRVG